MKAWLLMLLLAVPVRAEDAGAVAAALKDPAAECRYLTRLCADAESAVKAFEAVITEAKAGRLPLSRTYGEEAAAAHAINAITAAERVIVAKRGKAPACWKGCPK